MWNFPRHYLRHLKEGLLCCLKKDLFEALSYQTADLKKSDPNITDTYPDVGTKRSRVQVDLMKLQKVVQTAKQAPATDSRQEAQKIKSI